MRLNREPAGSVSCLHIESTTLAPPGCIKYATLTPTSSCKCWSAKELLPMPKTETGSLSAQLLNLASHTPTTALFLEQALKAVRAVAKADFAAVFRGERGLSLIHI